MDGATLFRGPARAGRGSARSRGNDAGGRGGAPRVGDGPINGAPFALYADRVLAPTLAPGDAVVLDNRGSRKSRAVRRAGAHLLFLPPRSSDLNPVEQPFAKLERLRRKAEPRTAEAAWRKVGDLRGLFSPAEGANRLANSGCASA